MQWKWNAISPRHFIPKINDPMLLQKGASCILVVLCSLILVYAFVKGHRAKKTNSIGEIKQYIKQCFVEASLHYRKEQEEDHAAGI